jgi:tRNA(Ile)-lysidine synthase
MFQHGLHEIVERFFREHCTAPCSVCVAVSGGADSVALVRLVSEMKETLGITRLGVAHVNHRIRGAASDEDAAFVKRLAREAGAAFHLRRVDRRRVPSTGVEEWARNIRYDFFAKVAGKFGYTCVATAHTRNDQAETVLARLLRGSGVHGLCGIAPVRQDGVIRPLLEADKGDIREFLSARRIAFREDSTNADTSYTRNWLRHKVIPLLEQREPSAVRHIAAAAQNARSVSRIVGPIINKWINDNVVLLGPRRFLVKRTGLISDSAGGEGIVRLLAEKRVGFDQDHVAGIFQNAGRSSGIFLLPGGWRYTCKKEGLEFSSGCDKPASRNFRCNIVPGKISVCKAKKCSLSVELYARKKNEPISFADPMIARLDASTCRGPLEFRSIGRGERFWPFGATGPVNCAEFLKKQGIPADQRSDWGVVARKRGEIVWVVGLRIGHGFRITSATKTVIQISCKPIG